jgi:hypothetical protein
MALACCSYDSHAFITPYVVIDTFEGLGGIAALLTFPVIEPDLDSDAE